MTDKDQALMAAREALIGHGDECKDVNDALALIDAALAAQRQWVGLTDEERMDCIFATNWSKTPLRDTAKLIEAKLKEKNSG